MRIFRLKTQGRAMLLPQLRKLEESIDYPFGVDRFRIDHGAEYFQFFDRLGEVACYVATDGVSLAAVGAAVLRNIPQSHKTTKAWYLCDLKVSPQFRGLGLTAKLFKSGFIRSYLKCSKAYGISMNPADGSPNPVVKLLEKLPLAPLQVAGQLIIYSLDFESMRAVAPVLGVARGRLSYLSHAGRKDLILKSTQAPLPLLHVQFGPCAELGYDHPQAGFTHMFCALESDPLNAELKQLGYQPSSVATLLHYNLRNFDWSFILTSDL